MTNGITVDANVMCLFTKSLILESATDERAIVELIRGKQGFVIDEQGQMKNQWLETCGNAVFGVWFIEQLKQGVIREVKAKLDLSHKKKLQNDCGMPRKREMFYVAVAAVSQDKYIVTGDIDFWEPNAKGSDNDKKIGIMTARKGEVCKYLRKRLQITVANPKMALAEL